jgi:hypothetical protein
MTRVESRSAIGSSTADEREGGVQHSGYQRDMAGKFPSVEKGECCECGFYGNR